MGIITLTVDDEVERKFRNMVEKKSSKKKGSLGKAATKAMEIWIQKEKQKKISEEALELMEKEFKMGKKLYAERGELHK